VLSRRTTCHIHLEIVMVGVVIVYVRPSCKVHVQTAPARVMVVHICKQRGQYVSCTWYDMDGEDTVDRQFIIASSSSRVVAWCLVEHATSIVFGYRMYWLLPITRK
jgi:hypothetical protein